IRFTCRDSAAFVAELKSSVAAWFTSQGRSDKANAAMVLKTVAILGTYLACYALLITNTATGWWAVGTVVLMGVAMAGVGFSVAHDALHGAYSDKPWVNMVLGATFDLLGANGYMWQITHNVVHHTYTNIQGVDEDLTVSPLLRLSPRSEWLPIHRFQPWYAAAAYSFSTIFWVFAKDYKYFLQKDIGPYKDHKHPAGAVAWLVVSKIAYYALMIVLPLLVIQAAWRQILLGFFAMHLIGGMILGIVFQLAHVVEGIDYPLPDANGTMEHTWAVHELVTTANFARKNKLVCWYVGGLNFQIEHHLFPKVCSIHYPAISDIVKRVAEKHGVPYHENPTMWEAMKSHWRMLAKYSDPKVYEAA
ncbi:MAG TPA: acyl-CoA desaturase, partial [Gemmatimonadales bacterium]|nr:acyl-CoA desaturase [Gemmatimonadales bacterium]